MYRSIPLRGNFNFGGKRLNRCFHVRPLFAPERKRLLSVKIPKEDGHYGPHPPE